MNSTDKIKATEEFVRSRVEKYDSGHDWWHIDRVRRLAEHINASERSAEPFALEIAALMHDYADSKFSGEESDKAFTDAEDFLERNGMKEISETVLNVLKNISFSKKNRSGNLSDSVYLIIQDADRLDAIGAIGVARAFNYGGYRNNPIWIPGNDYTVPSTISHFYEKLLLLKDLMNTETGRKLAEERHVFLEEFLSQFYKEWNIK
jgi:uncharacterized protein